MSDMTITEFCDAHHACREGREWALAWCETMADVWATAKPAWLLWVATRRGVLTDRELRLFALWSARQSQHLMSDPRSLAAIDVAERHASGEATDDELSAAAAAAVEAWVAARQEAWVAVAEAAAAAWVARHADWPAQADWLRSNVTPNFLAKEQWR